MPTVRIDGLDALLTLSASAPRVIRETLADASDEALLGMVADLASYPPTPPASRYRRSGTLGRLWTTAQPTWEARAAGFLGALANATPYGPYVQGEEQTAGNAHWTTAADALTQHTPRIRDVFLAALIRALRLLEQRA